MRIEAVQRHRVNRVMNFARTCNSEALTLENLADVACLSRYHFSRVFSHYCQETPIEFLSRLRLEQAVSNLMLDSGMSVTSIALEAGFSSSQAFSNAFSRRFGISPRNFRVKNNWYVKDFPKNQYVLSPVMSKLLAITDQYSQDREVALRTLPATRLAYVRRRGPYYNPCEGRKAARIQLIEWAKLRGLWQDGNEVFGVCPDNSAVTPPLFCQYDVGIAVEDGVEEDDFVSIQILPESTLATLEVMGPASVGREAWRWLISDWLPHSGMRMAGHVYYEIFNPIEDGSDYHIPGATLCMPVLAAGAFPTGFDRRA